MRYAKLCEHKQNKIRLRYIASETKRQDDNYQVWIIYNGAAYRVRAFCEDCKSYLPNIEKSARIAIELMMLKSDHKKENKTQHEQQATVRD